MKKEIYIQAFHATDLENAKNIIYNGFSYRPNKEHWLGNGIYFYLDYSLAEWWATKPSKKFGAEIKTPAILECTIGTEKDKILDLRELTDYHAFAHIYANEYLPKIFDGTIGIEGANNPINNLELEDELLKKIRCSFCDYLNEQYELDLIIGTFNLPNQPYLSEVYGKGFKNFSLDYVETQICVFNPEIIEKIEIKR